MNEMGQLSTERWYDASNLSVSGIIFFRFKINTLESQITKKHVNASKPMALKNIDKLIHDWLPVCNLINTVGATSGPGIAYPSVTPAWGSCYSVFFLCVCSVDRCLSFCHFSFGHCVICPSSIYGFWLPLWYLKTLLT